MQKKVARKARKKNRERQPKPLPSEPNSWNVGGHALDDSNNAVSGTLNGYEIFRCFFKPENFIEALVRRGLEELEPFAQEESYRFFKLLKEDTSQESLSLEEVRQLRLRTLQEELTNEARFAADFISSHLPELFNLTTVIVVETAKTATLQRKYAQEGKDRINAENARQKTLLSIWPHIRALLDIPGAGGDQKSTHHNVEEENTFRQRKEELLPLWKYITAYQQDYGDVDGWYRDMLEEPEYQNLSSVCPSLTLDFILCALRTGSSPSDLALQHAFSESDNNSSA
jgi:hypothetical protein